MRSFSCLTASTPSLPPDHPHPSHPYIATFPPKCESGLYCHYYEPPTTAAIPIPNCISPLYQGCFQTANTSAFNCVFFVVVLFIFFFFFFLIFFGGGGGWGVKSRMYVVSSPDIYENGVPELVEWYYFKLFGTQLPW